ncbi:putative MFS family arabinose efflux permease [Sphingobium sp. B7D2B]|uniref:MFS transporter n=1 Tax=Sphingobium sp. B7D2B TaxID=2940583 RepID=UPI00222468B8|nr:MFS transporter [Sphingobium sp. B7D2B]MCW2366386.1 putative MFS family arabinose efflux permease [Sphingobium sp. B7D2B]
MEGPMVMGEAGTPRLRSGGYQAWLVGLLSLNFGIVFFDRQALNVLMPFVQPELGLSNAQIGLLAGGLSFTWAIAAFAIGRLSDTIGNRKLLLVGATLGFSLCCFLSGMATSFLFMLCARMLMGAAEGGVMPISHAMVASEVDPRRRGLAQGIAQNFGSNLLGSFLAPVLLVWFGLEFGWRNAFFLASIPGIICALLIWFTLEEPAAPARPQAQDGEAQGVLSVLRTRNVLVCVLLGVLMVSYFVICLTFLPIYLTSVRSYTPTEMSWLIATLGISATIGSFAISGLSDWIGRRPVMIAMPLLGIILPLGALYWSGSIWGLVPIFFFGWGLNGIFPLFMATVPSESVDPRQAATALGLTMGSAEILGGVFAPSLAGVAADATSLAAPLWIMVVLAILGGIVAIFLTETAPSQRARMAAAP